MGHMSKKRMSFPMEVQTGSVVVKIYRVRSKACRITARDNSTEEKERFSFMVWFFTDGKRNQKMFVDFEESHAEAKLKAVQLSAGKLDAIDPGRAECSAYTENPQLRVSGRVRVRLQRAIRGRGRRWFSGRDDAGSRLELPTTA